MTTSTTQNAPTSAIAASRFLNSLGINVHTTYTDTVYANTSLVANDLAYLGFNHVRDGLAIDGGYKSPGEEKLAAAGYKFNFVTGALDANHLATLDWYAKNYAGSVFSVEGPNEVGYRPIWFNGGAAACNEVALQQSIYNAIHSDPNLKGVNVVNLTLGLQNSLSYSQMGNMSSAADQGNAHVYAPYGKSPSLDWSGILALEGAPTAGKPMVVTEAGYSTAPGDVSGVDETVQAKYTLDLLMDAAKSGLTQFYLYELLDVRPDTTNSIMGDHYGLFHTDGTPKLAATAVHNLTTILNDSSGATAFQTGTLAYTVTGLPSSGSQVLFEKQSGAYDIALWAEPDLWASLLHQEKTAPTNAVTVNFGQVEHQVLVFDPLVGTTPIATYTDVSHVNVNITDHPLIVEVENTGAPAGTFQAAPTIVSYSVGNSAVGSGYSSLKQITLAGDAPAGSTVTVFDDGKALGSVAPLGNGTYSFTTGVLPDGTHHFTALDSSSSGISATSAAMTVTIDTVAPNAPTIASFSPDSGTVGDGLTNANHITLTGGSAEANSTVEIFDGAKNIGSTSADASGAWSLATRLLRDGMHGFTAVDVDEAGNRSTASSALTVTVDTTAPTPTFTGVTEKSSGVFLLSGRSEPNSHVSIFVDGGHTPIASVVTGQSGDQDGRWSTTVSLPNTVHTLTASANDAAGNSGASTNSVVIGTTGNDVLSGTAGSLLMGAGGNDTFVFTGNFGKQSVTDFHVSGPSQDVIEFSHNTFASFTDVMAHAVEVGTSAVITADASHVVALANVNVSTLHASNFLLV
jgi:hypothetical protein